MRILALADEPVPKLWSERCAEIASQADLILSCGDLSADYLSYLTCFSHAPVVYVPGNHDRRYLQKPPEGCVCADGRVLSFGGVRVLGLGGSMRYRPDGVYMYSEEEMRSRIRRLSRTLRLSGGFDVLLTHAPILGVGDQPDLAHSGFACFGELLEKYRPAVMFHGHVHQSYTGSGFVRRREFGGVPVINACGHVLFDLPADYAPLKEPRPLGARMMKRHD